MSNTQENTLQPRLTDKQRVKILRAELRAINSDIEAFGRIEITKGDMNHRLLLSTLYDTELKANHNRRQRP